MRKDEEKNRDYVKPLLRGVFIAHFIAHNRI